MHLASQKGELMIKPAPNLTIVKEHHCHGHLIECHPHKNPMNSTEGDNLTQSTLSEFTLSLSEHVSLTFLSAIKTSNY